MANDVIERWEIGPSGRMELVGTSQAAKSDTDRQRSSAASDPQDQLSSVVADAIAPLAAAINALVDVVGKKVAAGKSAVHQGRIESPLIAFESAAELIGQTAGPIVESKSLRAGSTGLSGFVAPRVKCVSELYTHTKSAATYDQSKNDYLAKNFAGRRVFNSTSGEGQHPIDHPSEFEKAVIGAWFKFSLSAGSDDGTVRCRGIKLTEHDMQLVNYALHEMPFAGVASFDSTAGDYRWGFNNRKLTIHERKAVMDDVLSGGLEAAPIHFDDAVILTPLLHGEFLPLVNLITVIRGRRMEAFGVGNPTFSWGTPEGTNMPLFTIDGLITAFDKQIFPATGAMTLGLDFEEDAPAKIGQIVIERFGEGAKKTLDYICVLGNGVTEPQGVFNASGTAAILAVNGASGPMLLVDLLALQFGLTKAFRKESSVYVSNDTNFFRTRNLRVDPTGHDERRLLGMNHTETLLPPREKLPPGLESGTESHRYETCGYRHRINDSISNTKLGFFDFSRFRMYRRAGVTFRVTREGKNLVLANEELIVCRMRFGGGLELGGAGATITNAAP